MGVVSTLSPAEVVAAFHKLYYDLGPQTWGRTLWLGVPAHKCPLDLWTYQEIIYETRPDVIIECGTYKGGTSLFCACICDLVGHGRVLSVDVAADPGRPEHPRLQYVTGSSTQPETVARVQGRLKPGERGMVILDSAHDRDHVLREMLLYSPMVGVGCYLIVEDTNLNGHPAWPGFGPGPREAVAAFLELSNSFVVDRDRERSLLTFNPGGYLKRVK